MQAVDASGNEFRRRLQIHDVDIIFANMLFQLRCQLWAFRVLDRNKVFNAHRVEHLASKAFCNHACTDALAGGVNGRSSASGTTTDDKYFKRLLSGDLFGRACNGASVELGHYLRQVHSALAKWFTIEVNGWHCHDFARFDFVAEHRAVDRHVANAWVERSHDVQRLNNVRAVLARQREESFEAVVAFKRLY